MKTGERWIAVAVAAIFVFAVVKVFVFDAKQDADDKGIPFYSTADKATAKEASELYRQLSCRECHDLWGTRTFTQHVPAPSLDGIGSLRSEAWLYAYFSAKNPQEIIPSRLKKKYQMPSYAYLPEEKRRLLARYFASMKVKDWYLQETRKAEHLRRTGVDE